MFAVSLSPGLRGRQTKSMSQKMSNQPTIRQRH